MGAVRMASPSARPAARVVRARGAAAPVGRSILLSLQRSAGNAAVSRLVAQRTVVAGAAGVLPTGLAALKRALSPPLRKGHRGPKVVMLQRALNAVGAALIEDGVFGPLTRRTVAAFQADHSIRAAKGSGTVDEATWDAIRAGRPATASVAPGLGATGTWSSMSPQRRADFTILGYDEKSWNEKRPPLPVLLPYVLLTEAQRAAATRLGYTRESWRANRDATAAGAARGYAAEEAAAKKKAGAGVLPDKYVGSLRAKAMIAAEFGGDVEVQLPNVHLLSEAEMKRAYEAIYGPGTYTPINGFTVKPDIYLNKTSVWAGTTVHESLHIQEHATWDAFAYSPTTAFGEGATTILTELAMTRHGQTVTHHPYPAQVALVSKMNTHAGLERMRAAYFKGAVAEYRRAVGAGLKPGTTWARFRGLVDAGALAAAQARLR